MASKPYFSRMHPIIESFFETCKARVKLRVTDSTNQQLSSTNLIQALGKETALEIPHLGINNLADPEIGTEYFEAPSQPEGIELPQGTGYIPFVLYKVPINGPANIVKALVSEKPNFYWVDTSYLYYKRYDQQLMTSPQIRNEIREEFKNTMLALNKQLHSLMKEAQDMTVQIGSFIMSSIKEETDKRNQELAIKSSLNPFS